jgi:8-hydroxy-5-deazaflavin:NADPH oxidoreductase
MNVISACLQGDQQIEVGTISDPVDVRSLSFEPSGPYLGSRTDGGEIDKPPAFRDDFVAAPRRFSLSLPKRRLPLPSVESALYRTIKRVYIGCMATIGLIGAGHIGSQIARLAVAHGYDVVVSNSRGPETLSALIAELGPKARAATPHEAGMAGDLVVVTVPLKNYKAVPVAPLADKVVIDTNNYYPQRDGHIPELDNESTTTAELLQAHLPTSKVVKAFNHIYAAEITTHGQPAGSKNRRALAIAGNDKDAKAAVSRLLDEFGFDVVDAGPLEEGWRIQRDTPGYGPRRTAEELRKDLAAAKRYADMDRLR